MLCKLSKNITFHQAKMIEDGFIQAQDTQVFSFLRESYVVLFYR